MKKLIAVLLTACLLFGGIALADTAVLTPVHEISMDNYGTSECTVSANFDTAIAIDDQLRLTYTVFLTDLYDAQAVFALKEGDTVVVFGEEMVVETAYIEDDIVCINDECGVYFEYADGSDSMMVCYDYTDTLSAEDMGEYTLPLADPVRLITYRTDEDGCVIDGMDEQLLTPAEAKTLLVSRSDSSKPDYLSAFGSATKVTVKDGNVVELYIDWSSDS